MEMDTIRVNIFDQTCQHHVRDYGYFTSTDGRKPRNITFDLFKDNYDGITLFTDNVILSDLPKRVNSKIKIAWCLESPAVMSHLHNNIEHVSDNFDYIFTYRDDLIKKNPNKFLPNSPGGCYLKDKDINTYIGKKNKNCSSVVSGKRDLEGHKLRHAIQRSSQGIDFYGWGTPHGKIDDKIIALKDYMFHLTIENIKTTHYFSEKLIDSLASGCIPIYWGCKNIGDYFNTDGFIIFDTIEDLQKIKLSKKVYESKLKAVEENFNLAKRYFSSDEYLAERLISIYNKL
jgi:hypothetical protein